MKIDKLLSFGLDPDTGLFYIRTIDKEYVKMLQQNDDDPHSIIFNLDEKTVGQFCRYYSLYKINKRAPIDQDPSF